MSEDQVNAIEPPKEKQPKKEKPPKKEKQPKKEKPPKEQQPKGEQQGQQRKKLSAQNASLTFKIPKSDFTDWYDELMVTAGIVDKDHWDVKGMPIFLPYGYAMHKAIMKLIEDEFKALDINMYQFPAFIPKSFLTLEADHVKGFQSECFWHEDKMCLRPTSETAIYSMFAKWVKSEEDLPCMIQQTCNVYRYETKNTKPLIRVREIPWNETHTAHATREEALEILEKFWAAVHRIFVDKLSIDGLRLRRPDWDRFPGAEHTDVQDIVMPCGRVLQSVGAHYLGQHFSSVFNIKANDVFSYMTCIGISTRALAAVLSMHGDDDGLVLPSVIAPYQIIIVPILGKKIEPEFQAKLDEMKEQLTQAGFRVRVDMNQQKRPGEKYYYYQMKGVPLRIDFGNRDLQNNKFVLVVRAIEGKREFALDELVPACQEALKNYDDALKQRAQAHLQSRIVDCDDINKIPEILKLGGFARIPYWTMTKEGAEGAERIHDMCNAEIRGWQPLEQQPGEGIKCIVTGKPAKYWAYVARSY